MATCTMLEAPRMPGITSAALTPPFCCHAGDLCNLYLPDLYTLSMCIVQACADVIVACLLPSMHSSELPCPFRDVNMGE